MSLHGWNGTVEEDELSGSQGVTPSGSESERASMDRMEVEE